MSTVVIAYEGFGDIQVELDTLQELGAEVLNTATLATPEARQHAIHADALMVTIQNVPGDLIRQMKNCKIISRVGTGLDAIDIPTATDCGIWVTNVPDYSIDEVSTHTIALMLMHVRRLPLLIEMVRQTGWYSASMDRPGQRLSTLTLGVIGFGRIGRATALKAKGLGMTVIVADPYVAPADIEVEGYASAGVETLLRTADYVALHSPLTPDTQQFINATTLALMKPTAYLINTSRGGLIDEAALLTAVQNGQIAGAALDVLTVEPPASNHPFLKEERITLTPHNAWYSEQAKLDVRRKGAEEVVRVLNGGRPRFPANKLG